jgi:Tol biopolymer transport system component
MRCGLVVAVRLFSILGALPRGLHPADLTLKAPRRQDGEQMVVAPPPAHPPQLAFVRKSSPSGSQRTWTVNSDGTGLRRWHPGLSPVWSHDGRRVVFASVKSARPVAQLTVLVENADGRGRHRIARLRFHGCFVARWSPDDSRVAFVGGCDGDSTWTWIAGDGLKLRALIHGHPRLCCVAPAWSPDGRSLLAGSFGPDTLMLIDVATGAQRRIPHTAFDAVRWEWTWASSSRVLYVADDRRLYTVNLDGSGLRALSPGDLNVNEFELSPDKKTIVFTGGDGRRQNIYTMPAGGGEATKLTDGVHDFDPAWSPDGSMIAFVGDLPLAPGARDRDRHIFTMHADGSEQRDVSGKADDDESPHWIP